MVSISGVFAVTFSVVFAYVADVTEEQDRSAAYGLVSRSFGVAILNKQGVPVSNNPEKPRWGLNLREADALSLSHLCSV